MAKYRKGITALVGALVTIATIRWGSEAWLSQVTAVLTALGVYTVPNEAAA